MLVLTTPTGEQIPLMQVNERARKLSNGSSKTYTFKIPLNARIAGLDLSRCDAQIVSPMSR